MAAASRRGRVVFARHGYSADAEDIGFVFGGLAHDVYRALRSLSDVHTFLRHHVFCVWDFMSLLKALQRQLTCLDEVWLPRGDGAAQPSIESPSSTWISRMRRAEASAATSWPRA